MTARPPQEPFALTNSVTVIRPALWWSVMRGELVLGPQGTPRARTGALQEDLRRLAALMKGSEAGKPTATAATEAAPNDGSESDLTPLGAG